MSEIVRRAAVAMRDVHFVPICAAVRARNRANAQVSPPDQATEHNQIMQEWLEQLARAAFAELREPTKEMLEAGQSALPDPVNYCQEGEYDVLEPWRAMIDAALK